MVYGIRKWWPVKLVSGEKLAIKQQRKQLLPAAGSG